MQDDEYMLEKLNICSELALQALSRSRDDYNLVEFLTLLVPMILVPTASTRGEGWVEVDPPGIRRTTNATDLKLWKVPGVSFKVSKSQVEMTAFVWLSWQPLNQLVLCCYLLKNGSKRHPVFKCFPKLQS